MVFNFVYHIIFVVILQDSYRYYSKNREYHINCNNIDGEQFHSEKNTAEF